jgi:hypothetical protein
LPRLEQALRDGYHVLHFVGHGTFNQRMQQTALFLQDTDGNAHIVWDAQISQILKQLPALPHLVFLAACQSATRSTVDAFAGLGPKLVNTGVPALVAMQDKVSIQTARQMTPTFYETLMAHGDVDHALNAARNNLLAAGHGDAAVPVLFMRLKNGLLFSLPEPLNTIHAACQAQVQSALHDVRRKYDPELYVNRTIERELNKFFDTPLNDTGPNCFLIVAPAGSGKTNLLCELASMRVQQQAVLLLLGGNIYLGGSTGLLEAVKTELQAASKKINFHSAEESLHALHQIAEVIDHDALLFLDAVNEYERPAAMKKALQDLLRKTRGKRIKLVITCRDYYWGLFKGEFWEAATVNRLPSEDDEGELYRFASGEYEQALNAYLTHPRYQITGRPVGDAAEQCRHPLLLRFFCEAYRGQDIGEVEDIRLKELFDRYWCQKLESIAKLMSGQDETRLPKGLAAELGDYLLNIAFYMLHNNVRAVPLRQFSQATKRKERYDDLHSFYGRIRDEFIILEEKVHERGHHRILRVAFVYEEFMEYVMARSLMREWDKADLDEKGILFEIEKLTKKYKEFAQIFGVMVYLALMLREEYGLALWSLLLDQGEQWQKAVFEAFRKLPEDQLDARVFKVLLRMLDKDDEDILKMVLDTLKLNRIGRRAPEFVATSVRKLATHERESIRRRVALALGNFPGDQNCFVLVRLLTDPIKSVRHNAETVLKQDRKTAIPPLIAALKDEDRSVRQSAAEALGQLKDTRAVEPLIGVLEDENSKVRHAAIGALGQWHRQHHGDHGHLASRSHRCRHRHRRGPRDRTYIVASAHRILALGQAGVAAAFIKNPRPPSCVLARRRGYHKVI